MEIFRVADEIEQRRRDHVETAAMPAEFGKNGVDVPTWIVPAVAEGFQAGGNQGGSGSGVDVLGVEEIWTNQAE